MTKSDQPTQKEIDELKKIKDEVKERKDWKEAMHNLQLAENRLFRCQGLLANAIQNLREAYARVACLDEEDRLREFEGGE